MFHSVARERCTGQGACLQVCPANAIALEGGIATIDGDLCTDCGACESVCPQQAIWYHGPRCALWVQPEAPDLGDFPGAV